MTKHIEGLVLSELKQIPDDRGAVLHMMRCDSPEFVSFGECYFSEVLPGCVKAWKKHKIHTQNLSVPIGLVRLVVYDDREGSNSKGMIEEFKLGRPNNYFRLQIPPLLWYGFTCVSETAALIANCTDHPHDPTESQVRDIDHPDMGYSWYKAEFVGNK